MNKRSEPMQDEELLAILSEIILGYKEGLSTDMITAVSAMKAKAMKFEANENIDQLLEAIDDLSQIKDDILSNA